MTPQQAIALLSQSVPMLNASLQDHQVLQQALKVLSELVNKTQEEPKEKK